ncbi:unnamed protein product, partial [Closterium sp. NIES-54]
ISWQSKRQLVVALSTIESEYISLCQCIWEGVWLKRLFGEFGHELAGGVPVFVDNQSAIAFAQNACLHGRTKHMQVRWHFIREMVASGKVILRWCPTNRQAADILTKPLPFDRHGVCMSLMGMQPHVGMVTEQDVGGLVLLCLDDIMLWTAPLPGQGGVEVTFYLGPTLMGPPVALPVMQDLCPLRTPSAWRLLPVARPGHASVSACHTPRACIGFCTSHALGVRRFVPIACPRHALVFCSSHALGVWRFLHVTNPGRVVVSARRTPQACVTCDRFLPAHGGPTALLPVVPAAHSSLFPLTTAPLQTLHMDVWGPARISGQSRERYFLLVVDDYTCYTTVFPLRSKDEVPDILIPWIRAVRLQLREQFRLDLLVLCLHSDRGGEFSSDLLRDFCRGEGILQSFTLPASPQQNGIAERRIGLVMEVAPTSMIHVAAPHFLWLFVVRYTAHQLNLCVGRERLAMCRCSGSGVLVPLFAIRPRTSSPPILFPASSLAFPLTRLAGSFTTPPRAVSSPLKTSRLTSWFPFTVSSPTALPLSLPCRSSLLHVPLW